MISAACRVGTLLYTMGDVTVRVTNPYALQTVLLRNLGVTLHDLGFALLKEDPGLLDRLHATLLGAIIIGTISLARNDPADTRLHGISEQVPPHVETERQRPEHVQQEQHEPHNGRVPVV